MANHIIVGRRIALLRKQAKQTQDVLAERLGITAQAISKWENGHTLPDTALLPILAQLFDCTIDSILMPHAVQDAVMFDFLRVANEGSRVLATQFYEWMKERYDFAIEYNNDYRDYHDVPGGKSAMFIHPGIFGFTVRLDVSDARPNDAVLARVALPNCAKYMHLVDGMPEHIKQCFRCDDCTRCQGYECRACMIYEFEGVKYRQCHFIAIPFDTVENITHAFTLVNAEYGR